MRIGELAARTGVSVRSLRYYEEKRLLIPQRSSSGQRIYAESAVQRVVVIQELYAAGLSSAVVQGLLPWIEAGEEAPHLLERLYHERERIDGQVRGLLDARDRLDTVIACTIAPSQEWTCVPRSARGGSASAPPMRPPKRRVRREGGAVPAESGASRAAGTAGDPGGPSGPIGPKDPIGPTDPTDPSASMSSISTSPLDVSAQ
ncbi:MerR family transcriptional regulator [Nocardiopsis sediminis]|uniref:MerR family transcriptional regulator n=1 Tax=Nocardiopsis sediminis TaxID=1778267 RepID=A0ABV8FIB2_9ACTN